MDITDTIPEPTALLEDDRPPRRDPRQVIACFAVCALAAVALLFVARTHRADPEAAAGPITSTTALSEPRPEPRGEADRTPRAAEDGDAGFFDRLFADRLNRTAPRASEPVDGPAAPSPGDRAEASAMPAVRGRSFTIERPEDWTAAPKDGTYELASGDRAAGVAVSVLDTPPAGYRFEQWANEWESLARAELMPDLQVLERDSFRVDGRDGFRVRYTGSVEGEQLAGEMWWVGDGEVVWILSQAFPAGDAELEATCAGIARSFRPASLS